MADVSDFCAMTGASEAQAKALLTAFNGDVNAAVNAFFEDGPVDMSEEAAAVAPAPAPAAATAVASTAAAPKAPAKKPSQGNVRGFGDFANGDDDSDEEKPVETFIGGAKSGQMVVDPKKEKVGGQDKVAELLERARKAGAQEGKPEDLAAATAATGGRAFTGGSRTLSGKASEPAPAAAPAQPAAVVHTITFYNNGFVVNGGPLRALDDPKNFEFMNSISNGQAPQELLPASPGTPLSVNLVRKDEDWVAPPEPKYTAFAGGGNKLGGEGAAAAAAPVAVSPQAWVVDEGAATTSLRLRLRDGSVVTARFNRTHALRHVRSFIESVRPGEGGLGTLQTGMPPRPLDEADGRSLEELGLLGTMMIHKS